MIKSSAVVPDHPDHPDHPIKESVLGMPVLEVIDIWSRAGKPIIHLGPGRNCFDLEKLLSNPTNEVDLKRVRDWLDGQW